MKRRLAVGALIVATVALTGCASAGKVGCVMQAVGSGFQGRTHETSAACDRLAQPEYPPAGPWAVAPGYEQRFVGEAYLCQRESNSPVHSPAWTACMYSRGWRSQ